MRLVLFGTPEFATLVAEELLSGDPQLSLVGCVTAPDALVGRKKVLMPSHLAAWAQTLGIPTLKPTSLKEAGFQETLLSWEADIWLVVAYGKILPKQFLELMPKRIVNIHPSLLPQYRGASPLHATLRNGDRRSGVTLMVMDAKMDHGPIISQRSTEVGEHELFADYSKRMVKESYFVIQESLRQYHQGILIPKEQNHSQASYVSMIHKQDGCIDWNYSAEALYNTYRAYHQWPGVYTFWKTIKVDMEILAVCALGELKPGEWHYEHDKLRVGAGQGECCVSQVKPAGKNWFTPHQWAQKAGVRGYFDYESN
jgi:methionyl-tRNA formyltransferase